MVFRYIQPAGDREWDYYFCANNFIDELYKSRMVLVKLSMKFTDGYIDSRLSPLIRLHYPEIGKKMLLWQKDNFRIAFHIA